MTGIDLDPGEFPADLTDAYRPVRLLGQGGMGAAYLVEDLALERLAVVKLCHHASQPEAVTRFRREAAALARVQHRNVVGIFSVGEAETGPYLVMEYLEGRPLKGPGEPEAALRAMLQVADGLDEVHRLGLLHRDLKPENILVESGGRAVMIDFGLARDTARTHLTATGQVLGTLGYMAPEMLRGETSSPSLDWYGWAATLYAAIEGEPPYEAPALLGAAAGVDLPPPPFSRVPQGPLRQLITLGLSRHPDQRPAGRAALVARLRPGGSGRHRAAATPGDREASGSGSRGAVPCDGIGSSSGTRAGGRRRRRRPRPWQLAAAVLLLGGGLMWSRSPGPVAPAPTPAPPPERTTTDLGRALEALVARAQASGTHAVAPVLVGMEVEITRVLEWEDPSQGQARRILAALSALEALPPPHGTDRASGWLLPRRLRRILLRDGWDDGPGAGATPCAPLFAWSHPFDREHPYLFAASRGYGGVDPSLTGLWSDQRLTQHLEIRANLPATLRSTPGDFLEIWMRVGFPHPGAALRLELDGIPLLIPGPRGGPEEGGTISILREEVAMAWLRISMARRLLRDPPGQLILDTAPGHPTVGNYRYRLGGEMRTVPFFGNTVLVDEVQARVGTRTP